MNYSYPAVGARYHQNATTFTVWSPLKKKVELLIGVEEKPYSMSCDDHGYWTTEIKNIPPGTLYRYRIEGKDPLPDPASRFQPQGVHGPSMVIDPAYKWTDDDWKGVPMKDMIQYELHVGTFTSEGTFDGIKNKLSYLAELGVNTIELMPISQFPGGRNWGYDGVFPHAVQNTYGGPQGLKSLVNEAHKLGMAVILDVVYNHQGPEGNYLAEFGPYFTEKYRTFWGSAINFDDAWCDGVRNYYWQNALMWLDEYHLDGLRLDAVHAIWDFSASHFIERLSKKVNDLESSTGRKKILIAEFDLNNPRYISPGEAGGYGLSGQWIDEYHHALHSIVTGEKDGYYEDFGTLQHLSKALKDSYVYTGQYSVHRKKHFGVSPSDNPYSQFVIFSQNHDQVGNRMLGDRLTSMLSHEALKLTAAAVLLAPQVPMLFMGEEYGETNPFQYFISHTDKELVDMVRKGRKEEFSYFKWQGEVPDPQGEETFRNCILSWNLEERNRRQLYSFYRHLIGFRKTRKAMKGDQAENIQVFDPGETMIISFERNFDGDSILVVLNFDKTPVPYTYSGNHNQWKKIVDSSAVKWGGIGEITADSLSVNTSIILPPESALIFEL